MWSITGKTLRANGLEPLEEIWKVSSRLIVNKASFKRKQALLNPISAQLEQAGGSTRTDEKSLNLSFIKFRRLSGGFLLLIIMQEAQCFHQFYQKLFPISYLPLLFIDSLGSR